MKTLFLSIWHNWGKNSKNGIPDQGANGKDTTEAKEVKKIVDAIMEKGIPGVKLIKVPEGYNLAQRIRWINSSLNYPGNVPEPFAIEFHMDSAGVATASWASVWYNDTNWYTEAEGRQFLAEYTNVTGLPSRRVNSDLTNRHGQLGFVSQVKCASLLIELGFITNPKDLATVREKAVQAIVSGISKMNAS